jgi:hypothetical protein
MAIYLQKLQLKFDALFNDPNFVTDFQQWVEARNVSPNCSNTIVSGSLSCSCDVNYVNPVYTFQNGKCFKDDVYFGKVVFSDEAMVQVEVDNGNKYMTGWINTFYRVLS